MVKAAIADNVLHQILTRMAEYDVVATMNLNGDYISGTLAAQVGRLGTNYITGHSCFEDPRDCAGVDRQDEACDRPFRTADDGETLWTSRRSGAPKFRADIVQDM